MYSQALSTVKTTIQQTCCCVHNHTSDMGNKGSDGVLRSDFVNKQCTNILYSYLRCSSKRTCPHIARIATSQYINGPAFNGNIKIGIYWQICKCKATFGIGSGLINSSPVAGTYTIILLLLLANPIYFQNFQTNHSICQNFTGCVIAQYTGYCGFKCRHNSHTR